MKFIFRYSRVLIILCFLVVSAIFTYNVYRDKQEVNNHFPEIEIKNDVLECSVKDDTNALLKDVIATDAEDGDLTSGIIVESISKFVDKEEHICNVTYAVEDSEHHVAKASRKIKYTDYESPRFTLSEPLCFDVGSDTTVVDVLGAVDSADGNLSGKIKILSNTTATSVAGEYTVTAQVTNSLGDTVKFKSLVVIKQRNNLSPDIHLKENVVYLKTKQKFNPGDYIDSVTDPDGKSLSSSSVKVTNSNVNMKKAGFYSVEYSMNLGEPDESTTYLTVIVED